MANTTDPFAQQVHGTNPQYLIEKITRNKIYNSRYWKEECFGLTAATVLDKAVQLSHLGGSYGGNLQPSKFLCLLLKLLQLQPERDVIYTLIDNEDFKYVRLLGAFYLRMVGKAEEIYTYLEPLYEDFRKIAFRTVTGWEVTYVDEFVDRLLVEELVCDIALPHLMKRIKLEDLGILPVRESALEGELEEMERLERKAFGGGGDVVVGTEKEQKSIATSAVVFDDIEDDDNNKQDDEQNMNNLINQETIVEKVDKPINIKQDPPVDITSDQKVDIDRRASKGDRTERERDRSEDSRDGYRRKSRHSRHHSSSDSDRSRSRGRRRDSRDRRDSYQNRDRDGKRNRRRSSSRSRSPYRRISREDEDYKRRRRNDSRDRKPKSSTSTRGREQEDAPAKVENSEAPSNIAPSITDKQKKNEKIFDKMFGKKKSGESGSTKPAGKTGGKVVVNQKGEKVIITASEGSVEYWNQIRECLGMTKLKE